MQSNNLNLKKKNSKMPLTAEAAALQVQVTYWKINQTKKLN